MNKKNMEKNLIFCYIKSMELRTLKYFLAVAQEEGINRAAEVLNVTQPTLSRQLSQLEDDLGVTLFIRGPKKITLTNEGILFKRRAEEILSLVQKTQTELCAGDEFLEGTISIGCGEIEAVNLLSPVISSFKEKYPRVKYDIFTASADLTKEKMLNGLIDIGVLLEPVDIERFDFIRFEKKENWVVMMREDDPLAKKESISPKDLQEKPLIFPKRSTVQNEIISWLGEYYDEKNILITSNLRTNSAVMVKHGLGYSITIDGIIPSIKDSNSVQLVYRPLSPKLTANSLITWKKGQIHSPAVHKFIQLLKNTYQ